MPTHFYGDMATSNWAGGFASTLEADFEWMYDDGLGSGNLDCTSSDQSGCWGHRHDILWSFSGPIAMGAGYATGQYGPSMTELFVGGDTKTGSGQADAPVFRPSQVSGAGTGSPGTGSAPGTPPGSPSGHAASAGQPRGSVSAVATRRGAVALTVRCTGGRGTMCKLNVTVTTGAGAHPRRTVATFTITIQAGHSRVVRVALSALARRLLAAHHALPVRVVVRQLGRSGTLRASTVTLRAAR